VWREVYRVLKPGGYLLAFGGTRTFDLLSIAIRMAGFEIVDSIAWLYASGFPHGIDISKALDKQAGAEREVIGTKYEGLGNRRVGEVYSNYNGDNSGLNITAPATPIAEQWDGYNSALAPSHEPIIVAMKPREGTYANNAKVWGVSGFWIDGCRIKHNEECKMMKAQTDIDIMTGGGKVQQAGRHQDTLELTHGGRWPKNSILKLTPECVLVGTKKVRGETLGECNGKRPGGFGDIGADSGDSEPNARVYGNETVEQWQCAPNCPVRLLAEQTGEHHGSGHVRTNKMDGEQSCFGDYAHIETFNPSWGDSGTAARYFYQAKASRRERNIGCDELYWKRDKDSEIGYVQIEFEEWDALSKRKRSQGNIHPTVKPVDLLSYLVRLTKTPTGGVVLDPFSGSGTTGMACAIEGRDYIGIELNAPYNEIARRRIEQTDKDYQVVQQELF
jgi:site-specific DNA-methyltransferase (adenine-specific)